MSLNVNRNVTDQFYRYKMPRIIAKVEGKGNGIKTVIVNMPEVAKALDRPPTYPTKYFGCELGAQTQFDPKNDRFIVNGAHDASKLQDLLDGFIKRFVLCPECDNPETNLTVSAKKQTIQQRCIACGYQGMIDLRHKLTTFIINHPPGQEAGTTPSKKEKKANRKSKKDSVNGDDRHSPEANSQEQMAHDRAKGCDLYVPPVTIEDDDLDWGDDASDAAVKARMESLTDAARSLMLNDDMERTQQERMDMFYNFVKEKRGDGTLNKDKYKDVLGEAERLDVKEKAPLVLAELLFDENLVKQIVTHRNLFIRFTHGNQKAQKYLLGGFEILVGNVFREKLLDRVPHILKTFYDSDILDEEVLLDWDKKVSKKYVSKEISTEIHQKAAPLIKWLKEAEEESEDESEDDVEVVYTNAAPATQLKSVAAKPKAAVVDDIDIDAI